MPNILIVDDEQNIQTSLSLALSYKGHTVDTAHDGLDALTHLAEKNYDLILTDIFMPNMNGLELLKTIKQQDKPVPVIVITAYANAQNATQILQAGASQLLIKPFDIHALFQAVYETLHLPAESPTIAEPWVQDSKTDTNSHPSTLSILDETGKSISQVPQPDKIVEIAFSMLQKTFDATYTLLWVTQPNRPKIVFRQIQGEAEAETFTELETTVAAYISQQGQPIMINHLDQAESTLSFSSPRTGSLMAMPIKYKTQVMGGMLLYQPQPGQTFNIEAQRFLSILASLISFTLEKTELSDELTNAHMDAVQSLFTLLEAKSSSVCSHAARVACYALLLAKRINLSDPELRNLEYLALLHDIGKVIVPERALSANSSLTPQEVFVGHAVAGENIVQYLRFIPEAGCIIRHHHEWFNGQGFPDHLQGENIPLFSRIIAIADYFDIIVSAYPSQDKLGQKKALDDLVHDQGQQFDPQLVKCFLNAYCKILMINEVTRQ